MDCLLRSAIVFCVANNVSRVAKRVRGLPEKYIAQQRPAVANNDSATLRSIYNATVLL